MNLKNGRIHVYTGDGKGKTTAAIGLAVRAAGHGLRVQIIQFMKGEVSGEVRALGRLAPEISMKQFGRDVFVDRKNPDSRDVELARQGLDFARKIMAEGSADILILDEVNVALDFGLIPTKDVISLLEKRPPGMEIILTGRNAPKEILDMADLVTEMREVKHYYRKGVPARDGIER